MGMRWTYGKRIFESVKLPFKKEFGLEWRLSLKRELRYNKHFFNLMKGTDAKENSVNKNRIYLRKITNVTDRNNQSDLKFVLIRKLPVL